MASSGSKQASNIVQDRTEPEQPSEMTESRQETPDGPLEREVIFEILSNERRRLVLQYLQAYDDDDEIMLRDVVDQVAAWQNDTTVKELDSGDRKCVYTALKQSHLPKLDDVGAIDYDHIRGSVTLEERAADIYPYLEYVPRDDIAWSHYYLGLSGISAGLAGLVWLDVPLFGGVSGFALVAVVVAMFACSSVVHWYRKKNHRLELPSVGTE